MLQRGSAPCAHTNVVAAHDQHIAIDNTQNMPITSIMNLKSHLHKLLFMRECAAQIQQRIWYKIKKIERQLIKQSKHESRTMSSDSEYYKFTTTYSLKDLNVREDRIKKTESETNK